MIKTADRAAPPAHPAYEQTPLWQQLQGAAAQPGMTQLLAGGAQDNVNNADFNRFLQLLQANNSTGETPGLKAETPWWQSAASLVGSFL